MVDRKESVRVTASGEDFSREFAKLRRDAIELQAAIRAIPNRVNIRADTDGFTRAAAQAKAADVSINRLSGRLGLAARLLGALGPAAIPITAVAIPAITGLAAQFGFAAVGAGTAVVAFQGVGDALTAMTKAHLEPTTENLQAAQMAMQEISPAARGFVRQLREMAPAMKDLRDTAATGMFPGLTEGMESMESLLPKVERILGAVSGELGSIASSTGASLASERWAEFFDFLATDAPSALREMAEAAGNTGHALAEMWMAFDPVNDDFSSWLVRVTADFDRWAAGLSQTDGFAEFVDYLRTTGPQVADTLGSIGNALVQIVQAAAPIGGPVLAAVEAFAKAISAIADSDLGTPIFGMVAALSALNLAMRTTSAISKTTFGGPVVAGMRTQSAGLKTLRSDWTAYSAVQRTAQGRAQATATQMIAHRAASEKLGSSLRSTGLAAGKTAGIVGGLALVTSGAADGMGLTNTASLALMGTMAGPYGAAIGLAIGATLDLAHASDDLKTAVTTANAAMKSGDVDAMAAAYDRLGTKIKEATSVDMSSPFAGWDIAGDAVAFVTGELGKARQAQADIAGSFNGAAAANALTSITDGFAGTAAAAARATGSVRGFLNALASLNGNLSKREGLLAYTESLLDARAAIKESGETLTKNGEAFRGHARAGLESQRMLDRVAASALNVAKDMKPLAAQRYLQNARADFVAVATGMGMSRAAAHALARELLTLGGIKAKPKVEEQGATESQRRINKMNAEIARLKDKSVKMDEKGAAAAKARIAALQREIERLDPYKLVTINYHGVRSGAGPPGLAHAVAEGGTIPGNRHPYHDKVLAYLAPGEEVISNRHGQADRHRALLQAINARRYAAGGTVAAPRVNVSAPNVSLAGALAGAQITAVFPGLGKVVGHIVDDRIADHDDMAGMARRAGVN